MNMSGCLYLAAIATYITPLTPSTITCMSRLTFYVPVYAHIYCGDGNVCESGNDTHIT